MFFFAVRNSGSRLARSFTLIQTQAAVYDERDDPGQSKPGRTERNRVEDVINISCDKKKELKNIYLLIYHKRIIVFLVCTLEG